MAMWKQPEVEIQRASASRGRAVTHPLLEGIPDTLAGIAKTVFSGKPKKDWR